MNPDEARPRPAVVVQARGAWPEFSPVEDLADSRRVVAVRARLIRRMDVTTVAAVGGLCTLGALTPVSIIAVIVAVVTLIAAVATVHGMARAAVPREAEADFVEKRDALLEGDLDDLLGRMDALPRGGRRGANLLRVYASISERHEQHTHGVLKRLLRGYMTRGGFSSKSLWDWVGEVENAVPLIRSHCRIHLERKVKNPYLKKRQARLLGVDPTTATKRTLMDRSSELLDAPPRVDRDDPDTTGTRQDERLALMEQAVGLVDGVAPETPPRVRGESQDDDPVKTSKTPATWAEGEVVLDGVLADYGEFIADPYAIFERPLLGDVTVDTTGAFIEALGQAQLLRGDSDAGDPEQVREFVLAAKRARLAWDMADRYAREVGLSRVSEEKAEALRKARACVERALDPAVPEDERALAVSRAQDLLKKASGPGGVSAVAVGASLGEIRALYAGVERLQLPPGRAGGVHVTARGEPERP